MRQEGRLTHKERLWLSGFVTVSQALANDRLAIEEVRQALDADLFSDEPWLAPWTAGFSAAIRVGFGY